jgi:hypothetical protein
MNTLTNWNELMERVTNNGTVKASVTAELLNEMVERQVSLKVMVTHKNRIIVKVYE